MQAPVALITGAGRRIGAVIARQLVSSGYRVMLHYRHSQAETRALVAEFNLQRPGCAAMVQADLLAPGAAAQLIGQTIEVFGRLDALINNASSFYSTPLGQISERDWDELVGSNLKAPLFLSQAAAPELRRARGAIINLVDIHAERPMKGFPLYSLAKTGLAGLTRALARELAPEVRVNGIAPGSVMWPEDDAHFDDLTRQRVISSTPLKRLGQAEDIARTALFLLTDAPYITGQILSVDGGRSLFI